MPVMSCRYCSSETTSRRVCSMWAPKKTEKKPINAPMITIILLIQYSHAV